MSLRNELVWLLAIAVGLFHFINITKDKQESFNLLLKTSSGLLDSIGSATGYGLVLNSSMNIASGLLKQLFGNLTSFGSPMSTTTESKKMATPQDKIFALEYAVIKLAQWSIDHNKYESFEVFSALNNFSKEKVLMLPYFLSKANGHYEEMFRFFDKFIAESFGYTEIEVQEHLSEIKYFEFKENRISFTSTFYEKFGSNVGKIAEEKEKIFPEIKAPYILNEKYKTVYALIDHSIEEYKKKEWLIINFPDEAMKRLCKRHSTWAIYRTLKVPGAIDKNFLVKEKSMFSYDLENRMLV